MGLRPDTRWFRPGDCTPAQLSDFATLVRAAAEVAEAGLENRIGRAERLVFCRTDASLAGIAAVKNPNRNYRAGIEQKAGVALRTACVPLELGWVFVDGSFRGKNLSRELLTEALNGITQYGIFATTRVENEQMHRTLTRFDFKPVGNDYLSDDGKRRLKVFLRAGHGSRT